MILTGFTWLVRDHFNPKSIKRLGAHPVVHKGRVAPPPLSREPVSDPR
jgi:hypothetical protein